MLYEYAMTPQVFGSNALSSNTVRPFQLEQLLRGMSDNGLLADLEGGIWAQEVARQIDDLSPDLVHRVQTCLNVLSNRNRIVSYPSLSGYPRLETDWIASALRWHSPPEQSFDAVVVSEGSTSGLQAPLVSIDEALDSPNWLNRRRSVMLRTVLEDYQIHLRTVFRYASRILLIDPHLNPRSLDYQNSIRLFVRLIRSRPRSGIVPLEIHAGDPTNGFRRDQESVPSRIAAWQDFLGGFVAGEPNLEFRIRLWSDAAQPSQLHDRWILTDQCGIATPSGLDCKDLSRKKTLSFKQSTWMLLDPDDRRKAEDLVTKEVSPWKLIGELDVP